MNSTVDETKLMDPLRGEYGYLTIYDGISEEEARSRVRFMSQDFGIREFQFYDAFEGYSAPPSAEKDFWRSALFSRPIRRQLLAVYADEIKRQGGRAWFYVQTAATDPGDSNLRGDFELVGQHLVMEKPLLDVVAPNGRWAKRIALPWVKFAASLGFSGIHWDTLGDFNNSLARGMNMLEFLEVALPVVRSHGLEQTANFVDGAGWDPRVWQGPNAGTNLVTFPYWEVWTVPEVEDRFFQEAVPHGGGVFVCYPGKTVNHENERQNWLEVGVSPLDLLIKRWIKARCLGSTYLAVGDGNRHIQVEYFPDSVDMSESDQRKLKSLVFQNLTCDRERWGMTTRTTTITSITSTLASCSEANALYEPLDMSPTSYVLKTSTEECQQHCASLEDCYHFSYYAALGHCHVEDVFARKVDYRPGFIAGPALCEVNAGSNERRFSFSELSCLDPGAYYLPTAHYEELSSKLSVREAVLQCQHMCAERNHCWHFSLGAGLPGSDWHCSLVARGGTRFVGPMKWISGPPVCHQARVQVKFMQDLPLDGRRTSFAIPPLGGTTVRVVMAGALAVAITVSFATCVAIAVLRSWRTNPPDQRLSSVRLVQYPRGTDQDIESSDTGVE